MPSESPNQQCGSTDGKTGTTAMIKYLPINRITMSVQKKIQQKHAFYISCVTITITVKESQLTYNTVT